MKLLKAPLILVLVLITAISCSSETSPAPSPTTAALAAPTITTTAIPSATATPFPSATAIQTPISAPTPLPSPTAIPTPISAPTATPTLELLPEITIDGTSLTAQVSPPGNSVIGKELQETPDEIDPSKCAQVTDAGLCLLFMELYFSNPGQLIEVVQTANGEDTSVDPASWFQMSDRQAFVPLSLRFDQDYTITFLIGDTTEGITGSGSVLYSVR